MAKYPSLESLTVTMTSNTIILSEPQLKEHYTLGEIYKADIKNSLGITITIAQKIDDNTFKYTY